MALRARQQVTLVEGNRAEDPVRRQQAELGRGSGDHKSVEKTMETPYMDQPVNITHPFFYTINPSP